MRFYKFKNEKYKHLAEVTHQFKAETNADESTTKITIYGDIGDYWWDSTSAADVERALKNVNSNEIQVHINSPGGDAFDGIAIYNQLKSHSAKIIVHIDGLAASAASVIAMAGDEIIMNTGSMLMIHEASILTWGTKKELKSALNALEGLDKSLADIYMTRFKGERSEIETFIENETWFTVDEAIAVGLADEAKEVEEENEETLDAESYKNSVLSRFRKPEQAPIAANVNNILERFKRQ
ncbi:head maturation protease, ClpP-related [Siminovitchia fortis]|uniref:head maturation protease, ClpP-related n=1 Tax=Siminovitchia fortis TaxID=254758 RepID=UPI00119D6A1E|nr:head maturation protease, ClpP-related [Siminovitchia fortis]